VAWKFPTLPKPPIFFEAQNKFSLRVIPSPFGTCIRGITPVVLKNQRVKQALLQKFLSGTCTKEELELLFAYLQQDEQADYDPVMQEVWQKLDEHRALSAADADRVFDNILRKINPPADIPQRVHPRKPPTTFIGGLAPNWRSWAAVFAGLLLLTGAATYFLVADRFITQATSYGQTATVTLPDRSVVTLNGNSSLRYASDWGTDNRREVWLQGEAFFSVVHTATDQQFFVRTPDQASVEVLGTEFNVSTRKSGNRVVLSSGQVRLNLPGYTAKHGATARQAHVLIKPGEMVEFSDRPTGYTKKVVNPELYSSWTHNVLLLDNTPIREIARILQDTYGLTVQVADPSLLAQKVSGSTPVGDVDLLLAGLSKSFNLVIIRSERLVTIERQPERQSR
jgi:transmembrane sensor